MEGRKIETVVQLLQDKAQKFPHNKIEIHSVESITFDELDKKSSQLANTLIKKFGVKKGDKIAIMFSNYDGAFYMISYFAISKCGALPVPVNIRLPAEGVKFIIENSESKGIIYGQEFSDIAGKIKVEFALSRKEAENLMGSEESASPDVQISRDDYLDIIYTSGTTGFPKGVLSTHGSLFVRDDSIYEGLYAGKTFLHAVPLFTFAGTHAMMLIPLRYALNAIILPKFDSKVFLECMQREDVAMVYGVPFHLLKVIKEPGFESAKLDHIKVLMFGTAPMPPWAVRELAEKLPSTWVMNLYGATEAGMAGCFLPPGMALVKPDSVGIPLPPTEVKVIDAEGKELSPRQIGEIIMRVPGAKPRRYFKDEEATLKTWTKDGWTRTGDIGYVDEEGYLYIVDRKKDIIIRGGFNISSAKVEGAISSHPDVIESAVVGVPHQFLGEDLFAFVVVKDRARVSEKDIQEHLKDKLADNEIPRYYEFVDELPKNATGKVLKTELRQKAKELYKLKREAEGKRS